MNVWDICEMSEIEAWSTSHPTCHRDGQETVSGHGLLADAQRRRGIGRGANECRAIANTRIAVNCKVRVTRLLLD